MEDLLNSFVPKQSARRRHTLPTSKENVRMVIVFPKDFAEKEVNVWGANAKSWSSVH